MQITATLIGIIGTIFGIVGTICALYFGYQNYMLEQEKRSLAQQTTVATLDLKISNPPPYQSDTAMSEVAVKNVGQRTSGKVWVSIFCSWSEEVEHSLKFPTSGWVLQPNEEYHWKIRLGYVGDIRGEKITIKSGDGMKTWESVEKI